MVSIIALSTIVCCTSPKNYLKKTNNGDKNNYVVFVQEGQDSKSLFKKYKDQVELLIDYDNLEASVIKCNEELIKQLKEKNLIEFYVLNESTSTEPNSIKKYYGIDYDGSNSEKESGKKWAYKRVKGSIPNSKGLDGKDIKVAIMDTGINTKHKIFNDNLKKFYDCVNSKKEAYDERSHGTGVSGIIVSVLPNCDLYVYKIHQSDGQNFLSDVLEGFDQAIKDKVDVINMSFGLDTAEECENLSWDDAEKVIAEAIERTYKSGIALVAAAGNDSALIDKNGRPIKYPAKSNYVIAAGAMNSSNEISYFSSLGGDIYAPGSYVRIAVGWTDDYYSQSSGTSFSSPFVTAAYGVILDYLQNNNIKISKQKIKDILVKSVDKETSIVVTRKGEEKIETTENFGILNLEKLVNELEKLK